MATCISRRSKSLFNNDREVLHASVIFA